MFNSREKSKKHNLVMFFMLLIITQSFPKENNENERLAYAETLAKSDIKTEDNNHDYIQEKSDEIQVDSNLGNYLIVVNKKNKFDNQLLLEELVSVPRQYHGSNGKEYRLNKELLKNFEIMYNTAKKENINLNIISAYRSRDYQNRLYKNSVSKRGLAYTNKYIARPGYSEHETGLAIDVNRIKLSFEKTKEYRWLRDNSYKFGFILRYPKGKEEITGYSFEPWHYRYVGVDVASVIHKEDLTLEEYLERYGRE